MKNIRKRHVILVDGPWYNDEGELHYGSGGKSTIWRIGSATKEGKVADDKGDVNQVIRYFKSSKKSIIDRTKELVDICKSASTEDEIWLFGFSKGALAIRAVVDLLWAAKRDEHRPVQRSFSSFFKLKKSSSSLVELEKWIRESGAKKCLPKLCFVGLFDTIHDSSVDQSLQWPASIYLYHAASMHEDDNTLKVRLLSEDASKNAYETPKYVEAWFAGSHIDIGGGANQDGLSLYPLQWMLIEAQKKGLCLNKPILPGKKEGQLVEDIVQLVFPSSGKTLDSKSSVIDPWTLRYANNLTIQLYNLRISHQHGNLQHEQDQRPKKNVLIQARKEPGNHRIPANQRHNVRLNKTRPYTQHRYGGSGSIYRAIFASEETDTPSASSNELVGYSHDCAFGVVIHPSVYFLMDIYPRYLKVNELPRELSLDLQRFRETKLLKEKQFDPWVSAYNLDHLPKCRILVCGATGVGKSTLLNAVFGIELTQTSDKESVSHDINEALESDLHPGIIIHDSRGFQYGESKEVNILRDFIEQRQKSADPNERLDVIWLCIEVSSKRRLQPAHAELFHVLKEFDCHTPVIVVRTQMDKELKERQFDILGAAAEGQKQNESKEPNGLAWEVIKAQAEKEFFEAERPFEMDVKKHDPKACVVHTSKDTDSSIRKLVRTTLEEVERYSPERKTSVAAALRRDMDFKIGVAIQRTFDMINYDAHMWQRVIAAIPLTDSTTTPIMCRVLCSRILSCFGLPKIPPDAAAHVFSKVILRNLSRFMMESIGTDFWNILAGANKLLLFGIAPIPKAMWPAARMVVKCACDVIIILDGAIKQSGFMATPENLHEVQMAYALNYNPDELPGSEKMTLRQLTHKDVNREFKLSKEFNQKLEYQVARQKMMRIVMTHRLKEKAHFRASAPSFYQETENQDALDALFSGDSNTLGQEIDALAQLGADGCMSGQYDEEIADQYSEYMYSQDMDDSLCRSSVCFDDSAS